MLYGQIIYLSENDGGKRTDGLGKMTISRKRIALSLGILLLVGSGLIGCRSFLAGRVMADARCRAMEYVLNLKDCGNLPGFTSGEQGDFTMDAGKIILGVGIKYPLRVYVYGVKTPAGSDRPSKIPKDAVWYCYELLKKAESEEWRLIKAWRQEKGETWVDLPLQGTNAIGITPGIKDKTNTNHIVLDSRVSGSTNQRFRCENISQGTNASVVRISFEKDGVTRSFMFIPHTQQWDIPVNIPKPMLPRLHVIAQREYLQLWDISYDVPVFHSLKVGDVIGFREFLGTNEIRNVEATWDGEEMIQFSNGIGLPARGKTLNDIIRNMESALEIMSQPSSALNTDVRMLVSTNSREYKQMYPPDEEWRQIKTRKERLQAKGFRRVWYFKGTE